MSDDLKARVLQALGMWRLEVTSTIDDAASYDTECEATYRGYLVAVDALIEDVEREVAR